MKALIDGRLTAEVEVAFRNGKEVIARFGSRGLTIPDGADAIPPRVLSQINDFISQLCNMGVERDIHESRNP